jgi:hypothetical protein
VLLVFGAPCQLRLLAGQEHGRTIPVTDVGPESAVPGLPCTLIPIFDSWIRIFTVSYPSSIAFEPNCICEPVGKFHCLSKNWHDFD